MARDDSWRHWRRSARCDANACVEVAWDERGVAVRDSTRPGVHVTVDRASWHALLADLRGE